MTIEEAIKILDIETSAKTLREYGEEKQQARAAFKASQLAADELRKRQWISVKDSLPEDNQRILTYSPIMKNSDIGAISIQSGWMCRSRNAEITHWQPLPEPPKECEENA